MQFVDEARFVVRAGRGGDGSVSFNREKYRPRGGPDGGRGGDGGSVTLRATEDLSTLEPYARRKLAKAGRGGHGSGNNRAGERGEDVVLDVPVGTQVYDEDGLLADLSEPGEAVVVARGGEGGRGNASFATSTALGYAPASVRLRWAHPVLRVSVPFVTLRLTSTSAVPASGSEMEIAFPFPVENVSA